MTTDVPSVLITFNVLFLPVWIFHVKNIDNYYAYKKQNFKANIGVYVICRYETYMVKNMYSMYNLAQVKIFVAGQLTFSNC